MQSGSKGPMDAPLISVLMPIFNGERFLREAIESIIVQTEARWELLCLDDGSSDRSLEIVEEHAARDRRIISVGFPHRGIPVSLQAGMTIARGTYFARMDQDDISYPNRFAAQINHLAANPDCVLVGTSYNVLQNGELTPGYKLAPRWTYVPAHREGVFVCTPSTMMRADPARLVGYREQFDCAEDSDFLQRMLRLGHIDNLSETLLTYRRHAGQISSVRADLQSLQNGVALTLGAELEPPDHLPDGGLNAASVEAMANASTRSLGARLHLELADFHTRAAPATRASTDLVLTHLAAAWRSEPRVHKEGRAREIYRHARQALSAARRHRDAMTLVVREGAIDPVYFTRRVVRRLASALVGPPSTVG